MHCRQSTRSHWPLLGSNTLHCLDRTYRLHGTGRWPCTSPDSSPYTCRTGTCPSAYTHFRPSTPSRRPCSGSSTFPSTGCTPPRRGIGPTRRTSPGSTQYKLPQRTYPSAYTHFRPSTPSRRPCSGSSTFPSTGRTPPQRGIDPTRRTSPGSSLRRRRSGTCPSGCTRYRRCTLSHSAPPDSCMHRSLGCMSPPRGTDRWRRRSKPRRRKSQRCTGPQSCTRSRRCKPSRSPSRDSYMRHWPGCTSPWRGIDRSPHKSPPLRRRSRACTGPQSCMRSRRCMPSRSAPPGSCTPPSRDRTSPPCDTGRSRCTSPGSSPYTRLPGNCPSACRGSRPSTRSHLQS